MTLRLQYYYHMTAAKVMVCFHFVFTVGIWMTWMTKKWMDPFNIKCTTKRSVNLGAIMQGLFVQSFQKYEDKLHAESD